MPTAAPAPAERLATILLSLSLAVAGCRAGERLCLSLVGLLMGRIQNIKQRVADLAARLREGRHAAPRRSAPPRPPAAFRPRQPSKLPRKFGWLLQRVPEVVQCRGQLEFLLQDPEMAAVLAAAPAALARPLRSLCWMLRIDPPKILAPPPETKPRPPRKPRPKVPKAPRPGSPQPLPPNLPDWLQDRRKPWSLTRIRGRR